MRREGIRETRSKECTDWGSQTTEQVNKAGNHPKRREENKQALKWPGMRERVETSEGGTNSC